MENEKKKGIDVLNILSNRTFIEEEKSFTTNHILIGNQGNKITEAGLDAVKDLLNKLYEHLPSKDMLLHQKILLDFIKFQLVNVNNANESISNLYFIENNFNNSHTINVLLTLYDELNLTKLKDELSFITKSFNGVVKRTKAQREQGLIGEQQQVNDIQKISSLLAKFYHWLIFNERDFADLVENNLLKTMIITSVIVRGKIKRDKTQCVGKCGKTYLINEKPVGSKCDCGGEIIQAPPIVEFQDISYVFPEGISEIKTEKENSPSNIFNLVSNVLIPNELLLILNRVFLGKFSQLLCIPNFSQFVIPETNDLINVYAGYNIIGEDNIFITYFVTDSRFNDSRLISSEKLPSIIKQVISDLKQGYSWKSTINNSLLKNWYITSFVPIEKLSEYDHLEHLINKDTFYEPESETPLEVVESEGDQIDD